MISAILSSRRFLEVVKTLCFVLLLALVFFGGYRFGIRKSVENGAVALLLADEDFRDYAAEKMANSNERVKMETLAKSVVCRTDTVYEPVPCAQYEDGRETMKYNGNQRKWIAETQAYQKKQKERGITGKEKMLCWVQYREAKTAEEKKKICLRDNGLCEIAMGGCD